MFKPEILNKISIKQLKNLNFKIKKFSFFPKIRKKTKNELVEK